MGAQPDISIVIPIYNEAETLPELHRRLTALFERLDADVEVLLVDDGSRDASYALMLGLRRKDPRFKLVRFSRNFGHQRAVSAGLDLAAGRAVVVMDADLQDPPEVVVDMVARWREGYDVVYAVRESREGEGWFKRAACSVFYRLLKRLTDVDIPVDVGDFRLVDRRALDVLKVLREESRYVRGLVSWIGFRQIGVPYVRQGRFAGRSKYPLRKLVRLAVDGLVSFSNAPLRLVISAGLVVSAGAFFAGLAAVAARLLDAFIVPGWASVIVAVAFLGGVQLVVVGMMGEYVGRIYEEVKGRPLYVIGDLQGFPPAVRAEPRTVVALKHELVYEVS